MTIFLLTYACDKIDGSMNFDLEKSSIIVPERNKN